MQQMASRQQPNTSNNGSRPQGMLLMGLIVFALAGLVMGFITGAVMQPKQSTLNTGGSNPISNKPSPTQTTAVTPTVAKEIPQGVPAVLAVQPVENADGQTVYTFGIQVTDRSNSAKKSGNPIQQTGFTCKMWFIQPIPPNGYYTIPYTEVKDVAAIQKPIKGQFKDSNNDQVQNDNVMEESGLVFDATTAQAQQCDNQGRANWKYTIPTSFKPGTYFVVYLTWGFQHDNWGWRQIVVQKAG